MDCTDIKVLLSGLIDDELDTETRHLAERHIAECRACRDMVDETEALHQLVAAEAEAAIAPDRLPEGFAGAVLSRTIYDEAPRRGPFGGWTNWLGWMAAAACLVLAITIWALDRRPLTGRLGNGPAPVAAAPPAAQPSVIPIAYTTPGRSWTFEGELPPEALAPPGVDEADSQPNARAEGTEPDAAATGGPGEAGESAIDAVAATSERSPKGDIAAESPAAPPVSPTSISRTDAETLDAAALLLQMLLAGDDRSFAEIESIRRVAEYDELPARLAAARDRLAPTDRPAVFAAESVLWRIVHGPLSLEDVRDLRRTVAESDLATRLETMSRRSDPAGAM